MVEISSMSLILIVIILIIGGIALVQAVNHLSRRSYFAYQNMALIDVVVMIMYILLCGFTGLLYIYAGYDLTVVYVILALVSIVLLGLFILYCVKNRTSMNKIYVILFVLYIAVVLYLTIFMRIGTVDASIEEIPFDDLRQAIVNRDPSMVQHMILNILFFVPFGFLIPSMSREHLGKWYLTMIGGLMTSTLIEGMQMIFMLGQSDVDDIIANTLGAVIGYGIVRFTRQIQKNWKL